MVGISAVHLYSYSAEVIKMSMISWFQPLYCMDTAVLLRYLAENT